MIVEKIEIKQEKEMTNNYLLMHKGTFKDYNDGTIKAVYEDNNKNIIETTLLINKTNRNSDVFCVPSHYYCNLGCKMCHLTQENSKKNMKKIKKEYLLESIIRTAHINCQEGKRRTDNKNAWISFMGVGEPLLNLELIKNIYQREEKIKLKGNYRDVTYALSTMMPNNKTTELSNYCNQNSLPLKIHYSLHTPFSNQRKKLLPCAKIPVDKCLEMLLDYKNKINSNKKIVQNLERFHQKFNPIEIHYTLIDGLNDSNAHLKELCLLTKEFNIPIKFIEFNPKKNLKKSLKTKRWLFELKNYYPDLDIRLYVPPGHEVGSSCGAFTKHYYLSENESKEEFLEFQRWREKHRIE